MAGCLRSLPLSEGLVRDFHFFLPRKQSCANQRSWWLPEREHTQGSHTPRCTGKRQANRRQVDGNLGTTGVPSEGLCFPILVAVFRFSDTLLIIIVIIIIKGHSLRRACLQPATNTQNSKPRPPTTNAKSKEKLQNKLKHCSKLSTS